jgi:uncharacterized protein (TIGR02466 family)
MIEVHTPFQFSVMKVAPQNAGDLIALLCAKAKSLQEEDAKGGILSEKWKDGIRANSPDEYKQGGYTSFYTQNLFSMQDMAPLHDAAIGCFYEYTKMCGLEGPGFLDHSWVSCYGNGHFVPGHVHPNAHLSCVFYGESSTDSGHITFYNPALPIYQMLYDNGARYFTDKITLPAEKGCFYIFPSFMQHETSPHLSDETRIIYSANYILTKSRLGKNMWGTLNAS